MEALGGGGLFLMSEVPLYLLFESATGWWAQYSSLRSRGTRAELMYMDDSRSSSLSAHPSWMRVDARNLVF